MAYLCDGLNLARVALYSMVVDDEASKYVRPPEIRCGTVDPGRCDTDWCDAVCL